MKSLRRVWAALRRRRTTKLRVDSGGTTGPPSPSPGLFDSSTAPGCGATPRGGSIAARLDCERLKSTAILLQDRFLGRRFSGCLLPVAMDPPGGKRRSLLSRATHKIGKRVLRRGSTTKPDNDLKAPKPAAPKADNLFRSEAGTASAASPTGRTLAARQELREHFKDMAKEKAVFCHSFPTDRSLGFTICVARYGESGRRFIQVDATSPACDLYNKLKPSDELIAINDQLIYDVDEAGANVVKAAIKSSADRRVKLTFVKGELP